MIYDTLYDWQKEIVDKYKDRPAFGLFLDCGLGKTPLSLAFAEANKCTKVLVITINSKAIEDNNIDGSWWGWAEKSDIAYRIQNKHNSKSPKICDMSILNYESLYQRKGSARGVLLQPWLMDFIKDCKGHNVALIIDESHKIKDLQSTQTKAISKIYSNLKAISNKCYLYLLTGTPFTTGYIDLYSQLKFLGCPLNKGNFESLFCIRDNRPGLLGWQQPIIGYQNVDKLFDLVHQYAITTKSKAVTKLPPQIFNYHIQLKTYNFKLFTYDKLSPDKVLTEFDRRGIKERDYPGKEKHVNPFYRNIDYPSFDYYADTAGTFCMRARQLSIGFQGNAENCIWFDRTRLQMLERFLSQNEDNYVLFYNYVPELLEIYEICDRLSYHIDVFSGEIKSLIFYDKYCNLSDSEKLVSKKNIILANFASGSTGKNWQAYNKCIIFSLPVYKDWEQGLKRVHRLGQTEPVIYHVFYQNNWLDLRMKEALETRTQYTEDLFMEDLKKEKDNGD